MSDIPVTLILPSGGSRNAEVPGDVVVKDLLPELTTSLELPTTEAPSKTRPAALPLNGL